MEKIRNKIIGLLSLVLVVAATLTCGASVSAKDIDIDVNNYGYGKYVVTAHGVGYAGAYDEDMVVFWYLPVYAEVTEDENTGNYKVDLDYNADDGSGGGGGTSTGDVASIEVNVYDSNGNLVKELSPIKVTPPTKSIELPFGDYGLPSGTYTIKISAYDKNGNELYEPYVITIEYKAIPVPDTGMFFQNLNISRTDFLVTGLIIFGIVGVGGAIFISKRNKSKRTLGRKRR